MPRRKVFRPAGEIRNAKFCEQPDFTRNNRLRGICRTGELFEHRCHDRLLECEEYVPNPWIRFENKEGGQRFAQPDGLLFDTRNSRIIIVECKLSHTSGAHQQLTRLYAPLIRFLFKGWEVGGVEICKHYTPGEYYPEPVTILGHPKQASGFGGIIVWN